MALKSKKIKIQHTYLQTPHSHESHPETVLRLKRASGHLNKVLNMTESAEQCVDILQQLSAVISALESCRVSLLQDHITTCVLPIVPSSSKKVISDLQTIIKRVVK